MEHKMITFENEVFGKVRTLTIDSYPWFVAADVCKAHRCPAPFGF